MNKYHYFVINEKHETKNGLKFVAYTLRIHGSQNLTGYFNHFKNLNTVNICNTKKEAQETADFWNDCYKKNGTYLYQ